MDREKAADLLDNLIGMVEDNHGADYDTALRMGIEALSTSGDGPEPVDDTISRQAAIDALGDEPEVWTGKDEYAMVLNNQWHYDRNAIKAVPSAQPEIIRCTECKHYREYDSKYVENAVVVQCMADRYPISETIPDGWFCAGAERRTDEQ